MNFTQMILIGAQADYRWDSPGIVRLGPERDIAAYLGGDCKGRCLIFCHGNGENAVSEKEDVFDLLTASGVSVICPDYRGYGLSAGTLSEDGCYEVAHAAYDFLLNEKGVSSEDIFVLGYSLGSAIAVELAATRKVGGLILQTPFLNGMKMKHFWFGEDDPEEKSFPTTSRLPDINMPSLVIHGTADDIVPFFQGEAVFNLLSSKEKRFVPVKDGGHCDFQLKLGDDYIPLLLNFISGH
ncbi:MAG: alpha/beta hydrolase [Lentisphaeria bacterium]|nr:alpha/beta hydrolase [Lentisphaeria bacterium]